MPNQNTKGKPNKIIIKVSRPNDQQDEKKLIKIKTTKKSIDDNSKPVGYVDPKEFEKYKNRKK